MKGQSLFSPEEPRYFVPSFESVSLSIEEEKRNTNFQDLGFPIGTIFTIFDLEDASILSSKFQAN